MPLPERARRVVSLAEAAHGAKALLNEFHQDAAELHFPEHADFVDRRDDDDYESSLYDSTPARNRRDFGNWLGAVLRPKGRIWAKHRCRVKKINDLAAVKVWMEDKDEALRDMIYDHKSQFISAMVLRDHQYATFGNSVTSVEARASRTGLLFTTWHLKDCAWTENEEKVVDTMYRKYRTTVLDLCRKEKQGWKIPQKIKDRLLKTPAAKVECMHIEMPVDAYYATDKPEGKMKNANFVSLYVCMETKDVMHEEARSTFRYSVARWFRLPNSPYAVSPCVCVSNPDARTMQSMTYSIMQAGELAVEPPTIGQADVVVGPVRIFPGGTTWVDKNYDERAGKALAPLDLGKVPDLGVSLHQLITSHMGDNWYLNKLYLPSPDGGMTAHETERRWQEFLRVSQPLIEPAEPEINGSVLESAMEVCMDMGWYGDLSDMPEELEGKAVDFAFDNPIEDARKQERRASFQGTIETTAAAANLDPTVVADLDLKRAYRDTIEGIAPADWLHEEDSDEIAAGREKIAQEQSQAAAMAQMQQGAGIAKDLGQSGVTANELPL